MKPATLTRTEESRLRELEAVLERGKTFVELGPAFGKMLVEAGLAFMEIRDTRLYRAEHARFEDYCRERWQVGASRAQQLIWVAQGARVEREGVLFPEGVERIPTYGEQLDRDRELPPADFLRARGWSQSRFPNGTRHASDDTPSRARVWRHPDVRQPVTFRDALWLARYPLRRLR